MKLKLILFSLLLLFCLTEDAFPSSVIPVDKTLSIKNISRYADYIEDGSRSLKINDIIQMKDNKWKEIGSDYINFGYSSSYFWFRFSVDNKSSKTMAWLMEIDFSYIDEINLYIPDKHGGYSVKNIGYSFPFSTREVDHRNNIFRVVQKPGAVTYYFRLRCQGTISFNLNLLSYESYVKRINEEMPIYFIYFGIMIAMCLYNLFLFVSVRDIGYLYFSCFVATMILFELDFKGFAFQYLWPNSTWWSTHSVGVFIWLLSGWATLFLYDFINIKSISEKIHKILLYFITIPSFLFALVSLFVKVQVGIVSGIIMGMMVAFIFCLLGIYLALIYKPPSRQARIALLAFAIFVIAVPIVILTALGILPVNFFTRWAIQLGSSTLVLLLSFGLADKIHIMQGEIQKAGKKYRHLVESTDDIIFSLDGNLNFLSLNSSVKSHLGYQPEELINKNFLDLIQETFSERINIARQIASEYIEDMKKNLKGVEFRTTFKPKYSLEPKELAVKLEVAQSDETGYNILGKASAIIDDTLLQFLEYERFRYSINNYLNNAELISHRLTRNLEKYINKKEIGMIRTSLREAIINAIEHGNLHLTFQEKTDSLNNDSYHEMLNKRRKDPHYKNKMVTIEYSLDKDRVVYKISDQGDGFDHENRGEDGIHKVDEEMLFHGRGLAIIKDTFDEVNFNERGNQILLVKFFNQEKNSS